MNAGIYKIENVINGHCYIGQTTGFNERKYRHFYRLENNKHVNKHLQSAYKKYGKESFVFKILLYCEKSELTHYEQTFVDTFKPAYNICRECVDSTKGYKHTEESIRKMSSASIGNANAKGKRSEESKLKMSLAQTGKKRSAEAIRKTALAQIGNTYCLGKHLSEETKRKIGLAGIGRKYTEESIRKRVLKTTGRKNTEEAKLKMSAAHKNISDETRLKMSQSAKAYYERQRQQVQS